MDSILTTVLQFQINLSPVELNLTLALVMLPDRKWHPSVYRIHPKMRHCMEY